MFQMNDGNDRWIGTEELEQAVGFAVEEVVEAGAGGAEAVREALAGQAGEVGEGAESPLLEEFQVRGVGCRCQLSEQGEGENLKGGFDGVDRGSFPAEVGAAVDEDVAGGGVEGEKMAEIGGRAGGEMGGKAEPVEVGLPGVQRTTVRGADLEIGAPLEVEQQGVGSGEFEIGSEGVGEAQEIAEHGGFGFGVALKELEIRAAGEGPGG